MRERRARAASLPALLGRARRVSAAALGVALLCAALHTAGAELAWVRVPPPPGAGASSARVAPLLLSASDWGVGLTPGGGSPSTSSASAAAAVLGGASGTGLASSTATLSLDPSAPTGLNLAPDASAPAALLPFLPAFGASAPLSLPAAFVAAGASNASYTFAFGGVDAAGRDMGAPRLFELGCPASSSSPCAAPTLRVVNLTSASPSAPRPAARSRHVLVSLPDPSVCEGFAGVQAPGSALLGCFFLGGGGTGAGLSPTAVPSSILSDFWYAGIVSASGRASDARITWAQVGTAGNPPSPRYGSVAGTNAAGTKIYLFGGSTFSGPTNDMWALSPRGLYTDPIETSDVVNIALGRPAALSSTAPGASAGKAVDGVVTTTLNPSATISSTTNNCASTSESSGFGTNVPWWRVDLGLGRGPLDYLTLWTANDSPYYQGRMTGFRVHVSNSSVLDASAVRCPNSIVTFASSATVQLAGGPCATAGARYLFVSLPGDYRILTLCEVQVFQRRADVWRRLNRVADVARGKPASQSSTEPYYAGGEARRGVDGDSGSGSYFTIPATCTRTKALATGDPPREPWWSVDLGAPYAVSSLQLFPRLDLYGNPFRRATDGQRWEIYIGNSTSHLLNTRCTAVPFDIMPVGSADNTVIPCAAVGRFVILRRTYSSADDNVLSFCEVRVLAQRLLNLPSPRVGSSGGMFRGYLAVAGGYDASGLPLGDVRFFDTEAEAWLPAGGSNAPTGTPPAPRAWASQLLPVAYPASTSTNAANASVVVPELQLARSLLLFGGQSATAPLADAWALASSPACASLSLDGVDPTSWVGSLATTGARYACLPGFRHNNPLAAARALEDTPLQPGQPGARNASLAARLGGVIRCGLDGYWLANLPLCLPPPLGAPGAVSAALPAGNTSTASSANRNALVTLEAPTTPSSPSAAAVAEYRVSTTPFALTYTFQDAASLVGWTYTDPMDTGVVGTDGTSLLMDLVLFADCWGGIWDCSRLLRPWPASVPRDDWTIEALLALPPIGGVQTGTMAAIGLWHLGGDYGADCPAITFGVRVTDVYAVGYEFGSDAGGAFWYTVSNNYNRMWVRLLRDAATNPGAPFYTVQYRFNDGEAWTKLPMAITEDRFYNRTLDLNALAFGPTVKMFGSYFIEHSVASFDYITVSPRVPQAPGGVRHLVPPGTLLPAAVAGNASTLVMPVYTASNADVAGGSAAAFAASAAASVPLPPPFTTGALGRGNVTVSIPGLSPASAYLFQASARGGAGGGAGWGAPATSAAASGAVRTAAAPPPPASSAGMVEVARGKAASTPGNYLTDVYGAYLPSLAVDGNKAQARLSSSSRPQCYTSIVSVGASLRIDLGASTDIQRIGVYGPSDPNDKGLDGMEVWVGESPNFRLNARCPASFVPPKLSTSPFSAEFPCVLTGRYVIIRGASTAIAGASITVCEAQVFAYSSCPPRTAVNAEAVAGTNCSAGAGWGAVCSLACLPGYVPVSGSPSAVCRGSSWSAPDLVCAPGCATLAAPEHSTTCSRSVFTDAFSYSLPPAATNGAYRNASVVASSWWDVDEAAAAATLASSWASADPLTQAIGSAWLAVDGMLQAAMLSGYNEGGLLTLAAGAAAASSSDFSFSASVSSLSSGAPLGLAFNGLDKLNYYRLSLDFFNGAIVFAVVVAGTPTVLSSVDVRGTPLRALDRNAWYALSLRASSGSYEVAVNGIPIATVQDKTFMSGALSVWAQSTAGFDDVAVTLPCSGGCAGLTAGQTCAFSCEPGLLTLGSATRTCVANAGSSSGTADFDGTPLTCTLPPPTFFASSLGVPENSPRNTRVGEPLVAFSSSADAQVLFSIESITNNNGTAAPLSLFVVDACSGQVKVGSGVDAYGGLDFETVPSFTLLVKVRVAGFAATEVWRNISVALSDVNEAPTIVAPTAFNLSEAAAPGAVVGTLVAVDPEGVPPVWAIANDGTGGRIALHPTTGVLTVNTTAAAATGYLFDFEGGDRVLTLLVTATDGVDGSLQASALITLSITDANDPPILSAPAGSSRGPGSVLLQEDVASGPGAGLGVGAIFSPTLVASDSDTGAFAVTGQRITFALVAPTTGAGGASVYPPASYPGCPAAPDASGWAFPTTTGTAAGLPLFELRPDPSSNVSAVLAVLTPATSPPWQLATTFAFRGRLVQAAYALCLKLTDAGGAVAYQTVYAEVVAGILPDAPVFTSQDAPGLALDPSGGEVVAFNGRNLGPASTAIPDPAVVGYLNLTLVNPLTSALERYSLRSPSCWVAVAGTQVKCITPPGAGAELVWSVTVSGRLVLSPFVLRASYRPPTVTALVGAAGITPSSPHLLKASGDGYGPAGLPFSFVWGPPLPGARSLDGLSPPLAYSCASLTHTQSVVSCVTAPPTGGRDLPWRLCVAGQCIGPGLPGASPSLPLLSHAPPLLLGVAPGRPDVDLASLDTLGGQPLRLFGLNLGSDAEPSGVAATVNVTFGPGSPSASTVTCTRVPGSTVAVTCSAPPGTGGNVSLGVSVSGIPSLPAPSAGLPLYSAGVAACFAARLSPSASVASFNLTCPPGTVVGWVEALSVGRGLVPSPASLPAAGVVASGSDCDTAIAAGAALGGGVGFSFDPACVTAASLPVLAALRTTCSGRASCVTSVPLASLGDTTCLTGSAAAVTGGHARCVAAAATGVPLSLLGVSYRPPALTSVSGPGAAAGPTEGGGLVTLRGSGFGPAPGRDVVVTYRSTAPGATAVMAASACSVTVPDVQIDCLMGPGTGSGHAWTVSVGGRASAELPASSSYAAPVISAFSGAGATGSATQGGEGVEITGSNFGPGGGGYPITATYATNLTDGRTVRRAAARCVVAVPHRKLACVTAPGAGKAFRWSVVVNGVASVEPTTSYRGPSITGLAVVRLGSSLFTPPSPLTAPLSPNADNVTLLLTGAGFGPASRTALASALASANNLTASGVLAATALATGLLTPSSPDAGVAGSSPVSAVTYGPSGFENNVLAALHINDTHVLVSLPRGNGAGLRFRVTVGDEVSTASSVSLSYSAPAILAVVPLWVDVPAAGAGAATTTAASATVVVRDLPLLQGALTPSVSVVFGAWGADPTAVLATAPAVAAVDVPRTARLLRPILNADGSVNLTVPLPSGLVGAGIAVRVVTTPPRAAAGGSGGAVTPLTTAAVSDPSLAAMLSFFGPVVELVLVSVPALLPAGQQPAAGDSSTLACPFPPGDPAFACPGSAGAANSTIYQLIVQGRNFGDVVAGGATRPGAGLSPPAFAWGEQAVDVLPGPEVPPSTSRALFVQSWSNTCIVAYTAVSSGAVRVSARSNAVATWGGAVIDALVASYGHATGASSLTLLEPLPTPAGPLRLSSSFNFSSLSPLITSVTAPPFSPSAGGGLLRLTVLHIETANDTVVTVDGVPCPLFKHGSTTDPAASYKTEVLDPQVAAAGGIALPGLVVTLACRIPPGQGSRAAVVVSRMVAGRLDAPSNTVTIAYTPPILSAAEVYVYPPAAGVTDPPAEVTRVSPLRFNGTEVSNVTVPTTGLAVLRLFGSNLGPAPSISLGEGWVIRPAPAGTTSSRVAARTFGNGTSASYATANALPCAGEPLYTCWELVAPPGEGAGWGLRLAAGDQATPSLAFNYRRPTVTRMVVTTVGGSPASLDAVPTRGGVRVALGGSDFGYTKPPSGGAGGGGGVIGIGGAFASQSVTLEFGLPTTDGLDSVQWVACPLVIRANHSVLSCTLPGGGGANVTARVTVAGQVGPVSLPLFSFARPSVSLGAASAVNATASPPRGLLQGAGMPAPSPSPAPPFRRSLQTTNATSIPVLYVPTAGGATVTLRGSNFGTRSNASCVLLAWSFRLVAHEGSGRCNEGEDYAGEGEVPRANVLTWAHEAVTFVVPPGTGTRDVRVVVRGQGEPVLAPALRLVYVGANVNASTANLVNGTGEALTLRGPPSPRLVSTEGTTLVSLPGAGFGGPRRNTSNAALALSSLAFSPPLSLTEAAALPLTHLKVSFHKACVAGSADLYGARPEFSRSCLPGIAAVRDDLLTFTAPAGVGANRSVSVTLAEVPPGTGPGGLEGTVAAAVAAAASESVILPLLAISGSITVSYAPPVITRVAPSTLRTVGDPAGAFVSILGTDFGDEALAVAQEWTAEQLEKEAAVGGVPCATVSRERLAGAAGNGAPSLRCALGSGLVAGYHNVSIRVLAQEAVFPGTPPSKALQIVCDVGAFGRPGEACLSCVQGGSCAGYTAAGLTVSERHPYPVPLAGFYNLNESYYLPSSNATSSAIDPVSPPAVFVGDLCPPAVILPGRPVCIVGCEPPEACLGGNTCAEGYVSKAPAYRCASCAPRFYKRGPVCIACPDSPALMFIGFLLVILAAIALSAFLSRKEVSVAVISVGIDFFQVLSIFAAAKVQYPAALRELFHVLSALNLNLEVIAPECLIPDVSWETKFTFVMALLPVVVAAFVVYYGVTSLIRLCIRRQSKKAAFSLTHASPLVKSSLTLYYFLYMYLTKTALDALNCTPANPPDGRTYLQVVFEECWKPGGMQQRLVPGALMGLFVYSIGIPVLLAVWLWRHRELIAEDQLLRAKGIGDDELTNPRGFEFRRRFHRLYYAFKPGHAHFWVLLLLARKFLVASCSILFNRNASFMLAGCVMVMFTAFGLQVRAQPYMGPQERASVLAAHDAAVKSGHARAVRLQANIAEIEAKGRRKGHTNRMGVEAAEGVGRGAGGSSRLSWRGGVGRPSSVTGTTTSNPLSSGSSALSSSSASSPASSPLPIRGNWASWNALETTMTFSAVLVALGGIMYQTQSLSSAYDIRPPLTGILITIIAASIAYYVAVVMTELHDQLGWGRVPGGGHACCACCRRGRGKAAASSGGARASARLSVTTGPAAASPAKPAKPTFNVGNVQSSANPLFLSGGGGGSGSGGGEGPIASPEAAAAAATVAAFTSVVGVPDHVTWEAFKTTYAAVFKQLAAVEEHLASLKGTAGGGGGEEEASGGFVTAANPMAGSGSGSRSATSAAAASSSSSSLSSFSNPLAGTKTSRAEFNPTRKG